MSKAKTQYACSLCDARSAKWLGCCPGCGEWNTMQEITVAATAATVRGVPKGLAEGGGVQQLSEIQTREIPRWPTGSDEFDRVLGGGLVPGGVVLLGGDPGIGKSTLLMQVVAKMSESLRTLYVTGEESGEQVALRARRLGVGEADVQVLAEIALQRILDQVKPGGVQAPELLIIDSIQTLYSDEISSAPGSVSQVRECAAQCVRVAKSTGIAVILVGHVTKDGQLAGPRVLEHMVDSVLYFEGDSHSAFRLIRAVKNRFGAVNEVGVFAMTDRGLKDVSNPSALFLSHHVGSDGVRAPGSSVFAAQEGSRPLLVEIQALVDTAHGAARRLSVGLDANRLAMLLAVLHRHASIATYDQDVFINAVGGVRVAETAADLAVLMAIVSSLKGRGLSAKLVTFGEVGLSGEIRPAPRGQERLREAAKLGFTHAIIPSANAPKKPIEGLTVIGVDRLDQALEALRSLG